MRLKFVVDKKKDVLISKKMGFREENIEYQYKVAKKFFKKSKTLYQESWDKIEKPFSNYVEKITEYDWFYDEYTCIVSALVAGFTSRGGVNFIARHWKENPYFMRRITAHELILSHYCEIYKKYYSDANLSPGQLWALAEIAAWSLTSLTPEIKKWWPWNIQYYTNHNYPQLVPIQLKMKKVFLERKNFDDYINKGIGLIKRYPNIDSNGCHKKPGNIFNRGVDNK